MPSRPDWPNGLGQGAGRCRLALERGEREDHDLGCEYAHFVEHAPVDGQGRLVVLQTAQKSDWPRHHATASSSPAIRWSSGGRGPSTEHAERRPDAHCHRQPIRNEPVGEDRHHGDADRHAEGGIGGSEGRFEDTKPAGGQLGQGVDQICQPYPTRRTAGCRRTPKPRNISHRAAASTIQLSAAQPTSGISRRTGTGLVACNSQSPG